MRKNNEIIKRELEQMVTDMQCINELRKFKILSVLCLWTECNVNVIKM